MRLTTRTNLAMRTLMFCAVNPGRTVRRHEIAKACNASENHLAQVIHLMAQRGFIRTIRGRNGGLLLGREAEKINVGDVFRSFEAPLPFAECFSEKAAPAPCPRRAA
jgi:Rrf2 family transcriptional regulator, nitric oxide-sensitive transcriptional repressor